MLTHQDRETGRDAGASLACQQGLDCHFPPSRIRDKIEAYSMRSRFAIAGLPLLRRFRRGRRDRGRRTSR
jgi:hypothetical protein